MFFLLKKKSHCIRVKQPQKITRKHRQSGANKKKKHQFLSSFSFVLVLNSFGSHMEISHSKTKNWAKHISPDLKSALGMSAP